MSPNVLIAFDLDGTLIDSRRDLADAVNRTRASYGLPPLPLELVVSFVGNGIVKLVERALDGAGVDLQEAVARQKKFYSEHLLDYTRLYDGVLTGLAELAAAGYRLAVLTNKPAAAARSILKSLKAADYFDEIAGGDSGYPLKPDPAALLVFLKKYGCRAADSWMVGDHYTDLEAGRLAGMRRALALYGFGSPKDEVPDLKVESFMELVQNIRGEK